MSGELSTLWYVPVTFAQRVLEVDPIRVYHGAGRKRHSAAVFILRHLPRGIDLAGDPQTLRK